MSQYVTVVMGTNRLRVVSVSIHFKFNCMFDMFDMFNWSRTVFHLGVVWVGFRLIGHLRSGDASQMFHESVPAHTNVTLDYQNLSKHETLSPCHRTSMWRFPLKATPKLPKFRPLKCIETYWNPWCLGISRNPHILIGLCLLPSPEGGLVWGIGNQDQWLSP